MSNGIDVAPGRIDAVPGTPARLSVTVHNVEATPASHQVRIVGAESTWTGASHVTEVIAPGECTTVELDIRLPLGFPSGEHLLGVEAVPLGATGLPLPNRRRISDLLVVVGTVNGLHGVMEPQNVTAGWRARTVLSLRNRSDIPLRVALDDDSPGDAVKVGLERDEIVIAPGHVVPVTAKLSGPSLLWGRPRRIPFTITASAGSQQVHLDGSFQQRPMLRAGLLKGVAILAVFAVWASTLSYVFDRIAGEDSPDRAVAEEAGADGSDQGDGGSDGGDGSSPGVPMPDAAAGGKVEAREPGGVEVRLRAVSLVDELSQGGSAGGLSAAAPGVKLFGGRSGAIFNRILPAERTTITDDDGRWAFADISGPGFYELRFSKGGYQTVAYVIEAPEDGSPIALDVDMVAGDGAMSGRITDSNGTPLGDVDVTVTDGVVTISTRSATSGDVGAWSVEGLATPGSYLVTAAHRSYGTGTSLVRLSGGQDRTGVDLALEAGVGTILGTVRSPEGPLGGITVTATDGELVRTTSTLTEGPVGTFSLPQLAIPGTYTLTVSGEGWVTQTREVTIDDGEARVDFDVVASTGIVYGRLSDATDDTGVAGAGITATSDTSVFKSTTAPDGTYELAGLPAGTYVIEFERFEFETGSALVTVGPGGLREVDVQLTRRTQLSPDPDNNLSVNISAPGVDPSDIYVTVTDRESGISASSTGGGLIQLSDIPAGVRTLDIARTTGAPAAAAGLQPTTARVQMALRGTQSISVTMKPLVVIDLSVRDVENGSLDGARVVITRQGCTGAECTVYDSTTNANGAADPTPELSDGPYVAVVSLADYVTRSVAFAAAYDVRPTETVGVQLDRLARVSLDIVEPQASGGVIALIGVQVQLVPYSLGCPSGTITAVTDSHPDVISGVPNCSWVVVLSMSGYRTRTVGPITTALNATAPLSTVLARQPAGTSGTVVWTPDGEPDRPVAGATVTVVGVASYNRDDGNATPVPRTWTTTTDGNGQYAIPAADGPLADDATVTITHADFNTLSFATEGGIDHGTRALDPLPGSLTGRVELALGSATAPGTIDTARIQVRIVDSPGGVLDGTDLTIVPDISAAEYQLPSVPAGSYRLAISHLDGGFTPLEVTGFVDPGRTAVFDTAVLRQQGSIHVDVVSVAGEGLVMPQSGATVGLRTTSGATIPGIADVTLDATTSTHTFANLDAGDYQVISTLDGYQPEAPVLVNVDVGANPSATTMLRKLVWVSGRLLGDRGAGTTVPLSGATVTITQGATVHEGITGGDGTFSIRTVVAGDGIMSVDVPDYEPVSITFDGMAPNPDPFEDGEDRAVGDIVTDVLRGSLEGVVVSTAGVDAPPANLTVTLRSGATVITAASFDAGTGAFSYTNLLPGAYQLTVEAPNHLTQTRTINVQAGTTQDLGDVNLVFAQNAVRGEVLLRVGATLLPLTALGGTTVELLDTSSTVIDTQTTAADGSYTFDDLDDGTYRIRAARAGYGNALSSTFTLDEGRTVTVGQLTLNAINRSVAVTVRSAVGNASVVGATVTLTPTEFSTGVAPPTPMITVAGGVATFTNVVPGEYTAVVNGSAVGHVNGSTAVTLAVAANPTTAFTATLVEARVTGWLRLDGPAFTSADGATVTAYDVGGAVLASTTISGTTTTTGSFTMFVPTTATSILLGFTGLLPEERTITATSGGTTTLGTEAAPIVLAETATITFTLHETGGTTAITGDATISTVVDEDEITETGPSPVAFSGVPAGSRTFTITAPNYRDASVTITVNRTTMAHLVPMQAIGDATITIENGSGAPTVTLSRTGYTNVVRSGSAGDTEFLFEDLDVGTWNISVTRGGTTRTGSVVVTRGANTPATITFPVPGP